MGMSTHVVGFHPPNEEWQRNKAVWDACEAAGVAVPDEVDKFFNHVTPDPTGVEVDLGQTACVHPWQDDCREGYEIDVSKVPANVTVIRFYNSY